MPGSSGDDVPVELLRRFDGEPDDQYMARLVAAHLRVHNARFGQLEDRMSALMGDVEAVADRLDRAEVRADKTMDAMLGMEGRILSAIRADKAAEHAACKAMGTMAADVVRAWGSSYPLVGLSALVLVVYAAWLLDLVPRVETGVGTVEFTAQPQPEPPLPH